MKSSPTRPGDLVPSGAEKARRRSRAGGDDYYAAVDIHDYDETIVAHPYMDQIKAAIVADVTVRRERLGREISVLDVGTGSGQLGRALCGVEGLQVTLSDRDYRSQAYCGEHPELCDLPFIITDFTDDRLPEIRDKRFDVVCALGVFHHIPPSNRVSFLRNLGYLGNTVLIADEGILNYGSEQERQANARVWYGFVIQEAKRRGILKLAKLESEFMASDTASVRGPNDDFKQSPEAVVDQALAAGLRLDTVRKLGLWDNHRGGLFLASFMGPGSR